MTLDELKELVDFNELFLGIWSAVEYGNDREQYEEIILGVINTAITGKETT